MHWLAEQLSTTTPPDVVLHLGAGRCRELEDWIKCGARRIILVEPNPDLVQDLKRHADKSNFIEIVSAAVSENGGRGPLRLFNFPLLSSLREATGLRESLPGLRQIGSAVVELIPIRNLMDRLEIDEASNNWLVIDTPGEEAAVIQALERNGHLHHFRHIFLTAGSEVLYQGAATASSILERLSAAGFYVAGRADLGDGDWPKYHLGLNSFSLECKRLESELAEAKQQLKQLEGLENLCHEREKQNAALGGELESLRKEFGEARLQHQAKLELFAEHQARGLQNLRDEVERLKESLSHAQQAKGEAQEEAAMRAAQTQTLEAQVETANENARLLEAQLQKAQADLSLALRLQMLRENDLQDLQTKYRQVLTTRNEQQDLLQQLHHRLSRAAEYLKLAHSQPENQNVSDELLEVLTGRESKPRQESS